MHFVLAIVLKRIVKMKEVWYFLYKDFNNDFNVFSSSYYDSFDEAWKEYTRIKNDSLRYIILTPPTKGYIKKD